MEGPTITRTMVAPVLFWVVSVLGCRAGVDTAGGSEPLNPLVAELLKACSGEEAGGEEFIRVLRELLVRQGLLPRDVMEWHRGGGQTVDRGEARLTVVEGRRYVVVQLWPNGLFISGDNPLIFLLLAPDGRLLDQVDLYGDAFKVLLFPFVTEPTPSDSSLVYVVAKVDNEAYSGLVILEHGDAPHVPIDIPPKGKVKEALDGIGICEIRVRDGKFKAIALEK